MKAAVDLAVAKFGRLDCVHANAGLLRNQKITELTLDDFYAMVNVNLLGPVLVAKHAIPDHGTARQRRHLHHHLGGGRHRFSRPRDLLRHEGGPGRP